MNNPNSKQWSSATPGYIIFLVDQSGSMKDSFSEGKTRAEFTALVINRTITELIHTNSSGDKIKDRLFISIIGYGGAGGNSIEDIRSDYLSKFADNPTRIEKIKKKISDGAGGLVEVDQEMPIFLDPIAVGLTPMGDALKFAKDLIEGWLQRKPENPAPIIINISDGMPYNGIDNNETNKAVSISEEIMNMSSNDGSPLIFNAHIGNGQSNSFDFAETSDAMSDEQSKFLFTISSRIPESYKQAAAKQEFVVMPGSRGFVSNADPEKLIKFINFGSSGAGMTVDRIA